jgi:hypothetical protein
MLQHPKRKSWESRRLPSVMTDEANLSRRNHRRLLPIPCTCCRTKVLWSAAPLSSIVQASYQQFPGSSPVEMPLRVRIRSPQSMERRMRAWRDNRPWSPVRMGTLTQDHDTNPRNRPSLGLANRADMGAHDSRGFGWRKPGHPRRCKQNPRSHGAGALLERTPIEGRVSAGRKHTGEHNERAYP